MPARILASLLMVALSAGGALAQHHSSQPYAGLEQRSIASLSDDDLAEIRAGRGWGLALPAELNGVPGPTHVLEFAAQLGLTPAQVAALRDIRARMQMAAIDAGEIFVAAERALGDAFLQGPPAADMLAQLVMDAGQARAQLRLAHLSAHLETVPVLSPAQVALYNSLRGYGADDPCDAVPEGHNATMWRRHNGCE